VRTKLCDAGVSRCLKSRGPGALLRCLIGKGPCGGGGADAGFRGGLAFGGGQGEQLVAQRLDLALHGGGVERGVDGAQPTFGQCHDIGVGGDAGVRGCGGVVGFGDLRTVADLGEEVSAAGSNGYRSATAAP